MLELAYSILAALLWGFAFSGIVNFWYGIFFAASVLVFLSFRDRDIFIHFRFDWKDLLIGAISGVFLYLVFRISSSLLSGYLPWIHSQIAQVEHLKSLAPEYVYVPVVFSVSFAEEVFWRGFVLRRLWKGWGWTGFVLSIVLYSAAHITTGNVSLMLAAMGAGLVWGLLFVWRGNLLVSISSHVIWDAFLLIFGL